ncbi:MAG: class I SAM-dependent methyltransferase [Deltaproteobacteria bacterium]|nr:MAG: class I SAM-dependent methyltransferase [Deltaproteobacteria bacterium]
MIHPEATLYRCTGCQHCFTDLTSIVSPENYSSDYYEVTHKNWFEHPNLSLFQEIEKMILQYSKTTASVLDVGCGRGDLLKYLHSKNPSLSLTGIDLSDVPQIPGIRMLQRDFLKEDFPQKFDVVTSLAAIEHVEDVQLFAKKIGDLCAKDGVAIIMTNNESGLLYGIARGLYSFGIKGPFNRLYSKHHLNHFGIESMRTLFERHGFEILKTIHHSFPLKAVDIPVSSKFADFILRGAVAGMFFLGKTLEMDFMQTIVCRKKV